MAEQKLKLLESVLASPRIARASASGDAEAQALAARARQAMEGARAALAAGEVERALPLLDEALRAASAASARAAAGTPPDAAQRERTARLLDEARGYRGSIAEALKETERGKAGGVLERLDRLLAEAAALSAAGRHAEAGKLAAEAHALAVGTISQLRAGQTVTLALKFDHPADEFAYEQKRHQSNLMLVEMASSSGIEETRRKLMERYLEESGRLRSEAEAQARAGNYPAAIKGMEQANDRLMQALRMSGIASF